MDIEAQTIVEASGRHATVLKRSSARDIASFYSPTTNESLFEYETGMERMRLQTPGRQGMSTLDQKVLRLLHSECQRSHSRELILKSDVMLELLRTRTFEELANESDKKMTGAAKRKLKERIEASLTRLSTMAVTYTGVRVEKNGKRSQAKWAATFIDSWASYGGTVIVYLSPSFFENFVLSSDITFRLHDRRILQIEGKKEGSMHVAEALRDHYDNPNNRRRGTHNVLKLTTILRIASLPSPSEVLKQDRHFERKIANPIKQIFSDLLKAGFITHWDFCLSKKRQVEDLETFLSTARIADLYVTFELPDLQK